MCVLKRFLLPLSLGIIGSVTTYLFLGNDLSNLRDSASKVNQPIDLKTNIQKGFETSRRSITTFREENISLRNITKNLRETNSNLSRGFDKSSNLIKSGQESINRSEAIFRDIQETGRERD